MSAKFTVDYKDIERLEKQITQLPGKAEGIINEALHNQGIRRVVEGITPFINISTRNGKARPKRHAKTSKWHAEERFNLGFSVKAAGGAAKNKGSFGYLVFPNEGRGPHNPLEQRFMERGLEVATPKIVDVLGIELEKKIKEVF